MWLALVRSVGAGCEPAGGCACATPDSTNNTVTAAHILIIASW
jgi:hypothetical protein